MEVTRGHPCLSTHSREPWVAQNPPKFMWDSGFHLAGVSLPGWSQNWEQRGILEAPFPGEPPHEPAQCTDLLLPASNQDLKSEQLVAGSTFSIGTKPPSLGRKGSLEFPSERGASCSFPAQEPPVPRCFPQHSPAGFTSPNPRLALQLCPEPGQGGFLPCPSPR